MLLCVSVITSNAKYNHQHQQKQTVHKAAFVTSRPYSVLGQIHQQQTVTPTEGYVLPDKDVSTSNAKGEVM